MTLEGRIESRLKVLLDAKLATLASSAKPDSLTVEAGSESAENRPPVIVTMAVLQEESIPDTGWWNVNCACELRLTKKDAALEEGSLSGNAGGP